MELSNLDDHTYIDVDADIVVEEKEDDDDGNICIMMQCLSVTKNEHFLKRPVCQP